MQNYSLCGFPHLQLEVRGGTIELESGRDLAQGQNIQYPEFAAQLLLSWNIPEYLVVSHSLTALICLCVHQSEGQFPLPVDDLYSRDPI